MQNSTNFNQSTTRSGLDEGSVHTNRSKRRPSNRGVSADVFVSFAEESSLSCSVWLESNLMLCNFSTGALSGRFSFANFGSVALLKTGTTTVRDEW